MTSRGRDQRGTRRVQRAIPAAKFATTDLASFAPLATFYIYVNNHYAGYAPLTMMKFVRGLRCWRVRRCL